MSAVDVANTDALFVIFTHFLGEGGLVGEIDNDVKMILSERDLMS